MNLNRVTLAGRITQTIEIRYTPKGTAVARVPLAVNRSYKTESGQPKEEVTFIDCEVWGKTAETMSQYLPKGAGVFIDGRLKLDVWEDHGQKRQKLKVVVQSFQFLDRKAANVPDTKEPDDQEEVPF